jgi:hypothetical protein
LVGLALVGFVARRSHKIHRENIEDEAEGARERLMPGADVSVADYGGVSHGDAEERGRR